jgi:FixJ family two-component response regulator
VPPVKTNIPKERDQTLETIFVVDDDSGLRSGLDTLFRSVGLLVRSFSSAADCLAQITEDSAGCLVLDVRMPGLGGLELQAQLQLANIKMPIVFMTGHGDIPMTVEAMRAGAIDFLQKPFRHQEMLNAVNRGLEADRERRNRKQATAAAQAAYNELTQREREVLALVVRGCLNKQVAAELGLSEVTVKQHRGRVMRKMGVGSLAELVKTANTLALIKD